MYVKTLAAVVLAAAFTAPFAASAATGSREANVVKERLVDLLSMGEVVVISRDADLPKLADLGLERVALPAWKSAGAVVRSESAMPGKSVKPPFREEVAFHLLL